MVIMGSQEEEEQLKHKLEELENTVQRFTGRFEKNQREHELELRSTQMLLETIKSSGTQTQLLYDRVQLDLQTAKQGYEKLEKKANKKVNQLKELQKQLEELEKQS